MGLAVGMMTTPILGLDKIRYPGDAYARLELVLCAGWFSLPTLHNPESPGVLVSPLSTRHKLVDREESASAGKKSP